MLKFAGQGAQVEQVDGSIDFSGFSSRCSSCNKGGVAAVAATEQGNLEQVNRRARGLGAGGWLQRAIPIAIGAAVKKTLINDH